MPGVLAAGSPAWHWYLLVAVAVLAMSWGGPLFALIVGTPSFLKAAWRLTATTVMMMPGLYYDWRHATPELRQRWKGQLPLMAVNGCVLGAHFGLFSWSIDHTSFAHAMLVVSVTPMLIVLWTAALFGLALTFRWLKVIPGTTTTADGASEATTLGNDSAALAAETEGCTIDMAPVMADSGERAAARERERENETQRPQEASSAALATPSHWTRTLLRRLTDSDVDPLPPTSLEIVGSIVAFAGMAYLVDARDAEAAASGNGKIREYSLDGDVAAFFASVTVATYLIIGGRLRKWMPLWMYATPVTAVSALVSLLVALLFEPVTIGGPSTHSLFGWFMSGYTFAIILALAFVPGILGHTLANMALQRVHPLVLSVTQLSQPAISGVFGWLVGVQLPPTVSVLIAAPIILVGILLVVAGNRSSPLHAHVSGAFHRLRVGCGVK